VDFVSGIEVVREIRLDRVAVTQALVTQVDDVIAGWIGEGRAVVAGVRIPVAGSVGARGTFPVPWDSAVARTLRSSARTR
jgi:hypothetical protein